MGPLAVVLWKRIVCWLPSSYINSCFQLFNIVQDSFEALPLRRLDCMCNAARFFIRSFVLRLTVLPSDRPFVPIPSSIDEFQRAGPFHSGRYVAEEFQSREQESVERPAGLPDHPILHARFLLTLAVFVIVRSTPRFSPSHS